MQLYIYTTRGYASLNYACVIKIPSALSTVLIAVGVIIIVTTILCTTTVASVVCFIVFSKKKTAGEFVIITHNTVNNDIFLSIAHPPQDVVPVNGNPVYELVTMKVQENSAYDTVCSVAAPNQYENIAEIHIKKHGDNKRQDYENVQ